MSRVRDQRGRFAARVVPSHPILVVGVSRSDGYHVLTREVLPARTPRAMTEATEGTVPLWQIYAYGAVIVALTVARHVL